MGDGLKRAALAAVCSRGPWHGHHPCDTWTLTAEEVRAVFAAVPEGRTAIGRALGDVVGSRKADKALQMLRKAGLVRYNRKAQAWEVSNNSPRAGEGRA